MSERFDNSARVSEAKQLIEQLDAEAVSQQWRGVKIIALHYAEGGRLKDVKEGSEGKRRVI